MLNLIPTEHWDYGPTDLVRGLLTALLPRCKDTPSYIGIPGLGAVLPVRAARTGIVLALKALALRPGASVAVPLYCCPVVFSAIEAAGCRAQFIDVDPKTYCLSPSDLAAKESKVDAVMAVHMFGNVCDMPALRAAAPGKPFIEDCAQALGSRLHGRLAGSFGEVAVFSFRSGKYLSVGEGGAVYSSDANLQNQLAELIRGLPAPSRVDEVFHAVTTCFRSLLRSKALWGLVGSWLWSAYSEKVSYKHQSPIAIGQIYETDEETTIRRLSGLKSLIERQRWNADYYSRNLTLDPDMLCSEVPGAFYNRLQYPLLVPAPEECDRICAWLRKNQISTARPYKNIAAIATAYYGYTGDCPQAERVAKTVLVIPCNHALKAADVQRISACVNRVWVGTSGRSSTIGALSLHAAARQNRNVTSVAEPHHSS
jgi:perosamine synthetase